jgi:hypothetical protein
MARTLQAISILATAITAIALVMLGVGLVLTARPELAENVGLMLTPREGLEISLASGAVAIAAAVLGRVLSLLRDNVADEDHRAAP